MDEEEDGMKILAVSNEPPLLAELNGVLKKVFPGAEVIEENDPLMACKYSFNNEVNYVFASEDMKRMSGSDLLQFIKREHPAVKTYLIFKDERLSEASIFDDPDGVIEYPFSAEKLTKTLKEGAAYGER